MSSFVGDEDLSICATAGVLFPSLSFALREAIEKFRDEMCVLLLKRKKLTCAELFENNSALNWVSLTSGDSEAVTKGFIWSQKCEHFCPFPYPSQHTDLHACSFAVLSLLFVWSTSLLDP